MVTTMESPEQRDRYIRIFYDVLNVPIKDIAKHYELSASVVADMVSYVPKTKAEKRMLDKMPEMFQKWVNGKSFKVLEGEYGFEKRTIGRCVKEYGTKLHPELYEATMRKRKGQTED